jgi:hypothetical protein
VSLATELAGWLLEPATGRLEPDALLSAFVARLETAGLSLFRVSIWIPTKHPELWGNQLVWDRESGCRVLRRTHVVSTSSDYVGTPAERLHQRRDPEVHRRCGPGGVPRG